MQHCGCSNFNERNCNYVQTCNLFYFWTINQGAITMKLKTIVYIGPLQQGSVCCPYLVFLVLYIDIQNCNTECTQLSTINYKY